MLKGQVALGAVGAAIGVFALVSGSGLAFFDETGVPGPGFFPLLTSSALVVLGLLLLGTGFLRSPVAVAAGGGAPGSAEGPDPDSPAAEPGGQRDREPAGRAGLLRAGRVWLGFTVAVALLDLVGFLLAMALLVAYLLLTVEHIRSWRAALAIVLIPLAVYALFTTLLGVELPAGVVFEGS